MVFKKHVGQFHGSDSGFRFQNKRRCGSDAWFLFGTQSIFFPHVWSFTSVRSGLMHGICGILIRVSIASIDVIMSFASLLLMGSAVASLFAFFACQFT